MCGNVHISDIFCQTFCQFLTTLKPITFLEENKYFNSSWHFCFLTMTEGFWKLPWYLCRYISKISETFSKCMRDVQSFLAHLCPDFQACFLGCPRCFLSAQKKSPIYTKLHTFKLICLWFWFWNFFLICSYLSLKNLSFSNNLRPGGTNLLVNHQKFKAHSYRVGQWS